MSEKIRTIVVDTLTGIQNEMYMTDSKKPGFDKWMDFGKGICKFQRDNKLFCFGFFGLVFHLVIFYGLFIF